MEAEVSGDRRPSIVYEEDMAVTVRRTERAQVTVRIFGAEDAEDTEQRRVARSASEEQPSSCRVRARRRRWHRSAGSLEVAARPGSRRPRTLGAKLRRAVSRAPPPPSPDTPPGGAGLLRPESPTRGLGQFHKGRSSSIASTPSMASLRLGLGAGRRFSVDSEPRSQRRMRAASAWSPSLTKVASVPCRECPSSNLSSVHYVVII